jgi:hypothetical protein
LTAHELGDILGSLYSRSSSVVPRLLGRELRGPNVAVLVRDYPVEQALAEKVKKVIYHEIGHYFGLSGDDLSDTSVK